MTTGIYFLRFAANHPIPSPDIFPRTTNKQTAPNCQIGNRRPTEREADFRGGGVKDASCDYTQMRYAKLYNQNFYYLCRRNS